MKQNRPEIQTDLPDKDLYFIAVKLFLRDGRMLLITHNIYGDCAASSAGDRCESSTGKG